MKLQELRDSFPVYAKDIKINLGSVLSTVDGSGLCQKQIYGVAYSVALTLESKQMIEAIKEESGDHLTEDDHFGINAAVALMGMNNIYYRSIHLCGDAELSSLPAKLRMNVMAEPKVSKIDFEIYSLAVSVISGCGMCIKSHVKNIKKDIGVIGVQSVFRIASSINAIVKVVNVETVSKNGEQ